MALRIGVHLHEKVVFCQRDELSFQKVASLENRIKSQTFAPVLLENLGANLVGLNEIVNELVGKVFSTSASDHG